MVIHRQLVLGDSGRLIAILRFLGSRPIILHRQAPINTVRGAAAPLSHVELRCRPEGAASLVLLLLVRRSSFGCMCNRVQPRSVARMSEFTKNPS